MSEERAKYVLLEVAIHGLSEPPDQVAVRARQALANVFAPQLHNDLEVDVVEHAGGTCASCPHPPGELAQWRGPDKP